VPLLSKNWAAVNPWLFNIPVIWSLSNPNAGSFRQYANLAI
jgi:hypothetical protein